MKQETRIPFCGLYESQASWRIDSDTEMYFDVEGIGNTDIPEEFYTKMDYSNIFKGYAEIYADCFFDQLSEDMDTEIKYEFKEMISPKFYNFETDKIYVSLDSDTVQKIFNYVDKTILKETIEEMFTSRSGFYSFYSNNYAEWIAKPLKDWDCNEIYTLLFAATRMDDQEDYEEYNLMERNYSYESVCNLVYNEIVKAGF